MAIFNESLLHGEAAVVVRTRGRSPLVIEGPASVRVFGRWRQVIPVNLRPLKIDFTAADVPTQDGKRLSVYGSLDAQVVGTVEAATKVVDYLKATCKIAETAVRASMQERQARDVVDRRPDVEHELLGVISDAAARWGVSVFAVRIESSI